MISRPAITVACIPVLLLAGLLCVPVNAEAQSIRSFNQLNYLALADANCAEDVENWSLVAELERGGTLDPWIVRSNLHAVLVSVGGQGPKGNGKQKEVNLLLSLATVLHSHDAPPDAPAQASVAMLGRSFRLPEIVSGGCIDENGDGIRMVFECEFETEQALVAQFQKHGEVAHVQSIVAPLAFGDQTLELRVCVRAEPGSAVPAGTLTAIVGLGTQVVEY